MSGPRSAPRDVVITGAGSGIGRATAAAFARRGARLFLCDLDAARLATVRDELGAAVALAERVDVADRHAMAGFAGAVHAVTPAVDLLVNNAGVAFAGSFLDTSLDDFDWVMGVNLRGVVHGCHYFAPAMVARGQGGQIVNLSSVLGFWSAPQVSAYVASKFAVLGFSQSLRAELARHQIGVTALCPGMIATSIVDAARFGTGIGGRRDQVLGMFASRGTSPERVAEAVVAAAQANPAMRPVAWDGWMLWAMTRMAPGLRDRLTRRLNQHLTEP